MAIRRKHYRSYGLLVLMHLQKFKTLSVIILFEIIQDGELHNNKIFDFF